LLHASLLSYYITVRVQYPRNNDPALRAGKNVVMDIAYHTSGCPHTTKVTLEGRFLRNYGEKGRAARELTIGRTSQEYKGTVG
jgi:hypothetical protein